MRRGLSRRRRRSHRRWLTPVGAAGRPRLGLADAPGIIAARAPLPQKVANLTTQTRLPSRQQTNRARYVLIGPASCRQRFMLRSQRSTSVVLRCR